MVWSTIRRATDDDVTAVSAAWERFCAAHPVRREAPYLNGAIETYDLTDSVDYRAADDVAKRLSQLWARNRSRALGVSCDGIAHGYVGTSVR